MKKFFIIIITLILFLFNFTIVYSNEKIVFIDFEYIINNSDRGKLIFEELNEERDKNISKLKIDEKKIKELEKDIKLKKDIISKDELDKNLNILNNNIKKFQNQKKIFENELTNKKNKKMNNFMSQINSVLENYMNEKSFDIMLNSKNILIGKKTINRTDEILKLINENIK